MSNEGAKTGKGLERRVAEAYRRMGARRVEHDVEVGGHQIDVYAELETADRSVHRVAVEAKDYKRPVGIKIVREFGEVVNTLRRLGHVDEGVVVATSGFSRQARNAGAEHGLRLLTPEDLEAVAARVEKGEQWTPPPYVPPAPPDPETLAGRGRLPPGSRLDFRPNALFTGREEPLRALALALLEGDGGAALVTQAVAGMGGVGKTQLAVEFAYRYGPFFHGVHWLNAGRPEGLGAEVAACGEAMGLPYWPEKLPEQVARTLEAWRRGGRRLVVLDNLEEVGAAREWLGRLSGGGARVLVTARRWDWPRDLGLSPLRLEVFTEEESRAFLRRYVGEERATEEELDGLAGRLGHLPLALELAGRYLAGLPRVMVAGYLEKLEEVWAHPSMRSWREELGSPTGHDLDLLATFATSWERVEEEAARRVFLVAGYCAPNEPIPGDVLEQAAELDTEGCDEAVGVLAGLGLVEMEDAEAGPVVHPLLAEYGRAVAAAAGEEVGVLGAVAGALVKLGVEANATGLPASFAPLRPHVEAVGPAAEAVKLEQAGALWNELGWHLDDVADYAGARGAYERALAIWRAAYGDEDPRVAAAHNNVGLVLRSLGDLAGARGAYERALAILRAAYGDEDPRVATAHNNVGLVLKSLGDLAGARAAYERALAIDEQVYGPEHLEVATDVNNLGGVLQGLGDLAGARAAYERALAIDERVFGSEHPNVARDVNNLGLVLRSLGDLAGARECFERALAILEQVLGPDHPKVATLINNLGSVLKDLGDLAGAQECFERALAIDERVFGPEHPNVATDVNNLGSVLQDLGDLASARECFEWALAVFAKFLPEGHPSIETVRGNLREVDGSR